MQLERVQRRYAGLGRRRTAFAPNQAMFERVGERNRTSRRCRAAITPMLQVSDCRTLPRVSQRRGKFTQMLDRWSLGTCPGQQGARLRSDIGATGSSEKRPLAFAR